MERTITVRTRELILYIAIAIITTILASPRFTSQVLRIPKDHVFVGMTTYFEDFYYYLDQFYQGREGNWLTENRFSIERFPPTSIYFLHLILGRIGGWFRWESFQSYNIFGIIFKFLFILAGYIPILFFFPRSAFARIGSYLVFLYSTSLPNFVYENGHIILKRAIDVFRTENRILARFGTAPSGMCVNFIFIILLVGFNTLFEKYRVLKINDGTEDAISAVRKRLFWLVIPFFLLTLVDASKSLILIILLGIIVYLRRPPGSFLGYIKPLLSVWGIFILTFVLTAGYIVRTVNNDPVYKAANEWDVKRYLAQIQEIGLPNFLKGFGFQLPLFILGYALVFRKQKKTLYELTALVVTAVGVIGYIVPLVIRIPIPGFRFLFPALYVYIGLLAFSGIQYIAMQIRIRHALRVLLAGYLFINLITFFRGWSEEIKPLKEPEFHFSYIPQQLYDGLVYLRTAQPHDGNVLASPYTSIDLMIPGISGRYTYSGHFLTTYDSDTKDDLAKKFYFNWTDQPETHEFLRENNIRFIVVTKYAALRNHFITYYPFLTIVFDNPMVTIFRYDF